MPARPFFLPRDVRLLYLTRKLEVLLANSELPVAGVWHRVYMHVPGAAPLQMIADLADGTATAALSKVDRVLVARTEPVTEVFRDAVKLV